MSAAVHSQIIEDLYSVRPGMRLAQLIREVSNAPIVVAAAPCPAESILSTAGYSKFILGEDDALLSRVLTRYENTYFSCAARQGWSALVQPRSTMSTLGFTAQKYASGGIGLPQNVARAIERKEAFRTSVEGDPWHFNEEFGAIVLNDLKRELKSVLALQ